MLTVGIDRDRGGVTTRVGFSKAGAERCALPAVPRVSNHDRAGGLCERCGLVARAIVDDDDVAAPLERESRAHDHVADGSRGIERRDDGGDAPS